MDRFLADIKDLFSLALAFMTYVGAVYWLCFLFAIRPLENLTDFGTASMIVCIFQLYRLAESVVARITAR